MTVQPTADSQTGPMKPYRLQTSAEILAAVVASVAVMAALFAAVLLSVMFDVLSARPGFILLAVVTGIVVPPVMFSLLMREDRHITESVLSSPGLHHTIVALMLVSFAMSFGWVLAAVLVG